VSTAKVAFTVVLILAVSAAPTLAQNLYITERNDRYGFSDESGHWVIPPSYGAVKAFSEGLAPVYQDGGWGFIDPEGQVKIGLHFSHADSFSNGLAAVQIKDKWGYIDQAGKLSIEPRFRQAGRFSEGVAPVKSDQGWCFVDNAGTLIEGLSGFEGAMSFNDGLAAVRVGGKWRFITHDGKKKFDQEFVRATSFSQQLAAVQEEDGAKYGFIDRTGSYVIRPLFDDTNAFSEGLAAARLAGRWGYIDRSGQWRIPNNYPLFAYAFTGGLAVVSDPVRGAYLYINADGNPQFFKSTRPADAERGPDNYPRWPLKLYSTPPKANAYLIPLYMWDQGGPKAIPPCKLNDSELRDYLTANHDEFFQGQTNLDKLIIIEQKYMAIFCLGEEMQRLKVEVPIHSKAPVSVSFQPQ
jgi:WG containing repeat